MALFTNALSVLAIHGLALVRLLGMFGLGALLTFGLLRRGLGEPLAPPETFALSLIGWPLFWLVSAFLAFFVNRWLDWGPDWAVLLCAIGGLLLTSSWKKMDAPFGKPGWLVLALFLVFCISLFTRLAFIADLVVPSYFDGALHYSISQGLLTHFGIWPWQDPTSPLAGYYHIGFHLLTAVFAAFLGLKVNEVMLLLGQIFLAALPFPVFLIIRRATDSIPAAFFAFLLAGWGWSMPAYALNWGKYPAVAGLLALQFVLAWTYLATRISLPVRNRLFLWVLLAAGVIIAGLMHSRTLVVIALVIASYFVATLWDARSNRLARFLVPALILAGLVGLGIYLQSRDVLKLVFDPYLRAKTLWMTLLVALLGPFAFRQSARLALTSVLTIFLLLVCLLVPLPVGVFQTLLDRPFVQMTLYLPLAWLGGLGLAGLLALINNHRKRYILIATVAFGLVFTQIALTYNFMPSPCCILFKADDAVAVDMLKQRLPPQMNILIAGNVLNVFDIETPNPLHGSDGGIWVTPLTGQKTSVLPYGTDFSTAATFTDLCQRGITHIYVGGTQESFSLEKLQSQPGRYAAWVALPGAHLFQVVGCP